MIIEKDKEFISDKELKEIEDIEKESEKYTDTDYVPYYLKTKLNHRLLSKKEVYEYIEKAQAGDNAARDYIIDHNLKLIYSAAVHYAKGNEDTLMDLFQEGCLGALKAINDFKTDKGFQFSTYAMHWIMNYMQRYIMNHERAIRVPVHIKEKYMRIRREIAIYEKNNGTIPTDEELASKIGISVEKIRFIISANEPLASINKPCGEGNAVDSDSELGDFIVDNRIKPIEEEAEKKDLENAVDKCLKAHLTEKEEKVIRMRFGLSPYEDPMTLEMVGKEFGVTRERVRQIESKALKKIKRYGSKELKWFNE